MIKKIMSATLAAAATLGLTGIVFATGVSAAEETCNDSNSKNTNSECYWEKQLSAECTKYDNINAKEFTVPAAPAGNTYVEAIVKAGSGEGENEQKGAVKAGDVLTRSDGKDISHVILCYKPAGGSGANGTTPPTNTPVTGSGTTAPKPSGSSTPTQAAGGSGAAGVTSLPVTSGNNTQLAGLITLISTILASAGVYTARTRTDTSL